MTEYTVVFETVNQCLSLGKVSLFAPPPPKKKKKIDEIQIKDKDGAAGGAQIAFMDSHTTGPWVQDPMGMVHFLPSF